MLQELLAFDNVDSAGGDASPPVTPIDPVLPAVSTPGAEAIRRREAAIERHQRRRPWRILAAQAALLRLLLDRDTASVEDLRDVCAVTNGHDARWLGAVPRELRVRGIISHAGYHAGRRPESHGRPLSSWRIIDRPAALEWLAAHAPVSPPPTFEAADGGGI